MKKVSKVLIAYDGSSRDVHGFQHFLNGSVSSAVAQEARCAVEVSSAMRGTAQATVLGEV